MKHIILAFLLSVTGWCATYDPFLLETQLTLLPKIAILEKNLALSGNKTPIKIVIAHDPGDAETAAECSRVLTNKFKGYLSTHPLLVTTLPFDKLDGSVPYQIVYSLKANLSQLKKIHNLFSPSRTVTALYDPDQLSDAKFLLSIRMERTPVILVNANVLRENHFSFPDSLLGIARIIP